MKNIDKFIKESEMYGFTIRKKDDGEYYVLFNCAHCNQEKDQKIDLSGENAILPIYCDKCLEMLRFSHSKPTERETDIINHIMKEASRKI